VINTDPVYSINDTDAETKKSKKKMETLCEVGTVLPANTMKGRRYIIGLY
jgi:hypothetical protein